MAEHNLVTRAIKQLGLEGCWLFKVHGGPFQEKGLPDVLGCWPVRRASGMLMLGLFFGFEAKDGEGKDLEPLQEYQCQQIRDAGGTIVPMKTDEDLATLIALMRFKEKMIRQLIEQVYVNEITWEDTDGDHNRVRG